MKQSIDTLIHAIKWVNFTDGKKPDTKEHKLYDSISKKFSNRQNKSTVTQIKIKAVAVNATPNVEKST